MRTAAYLVCLLPAVLALPTPLANNKNVNARVADFPVNPFEGGNSVTSIGEGPQFASSIGEGPQSATAESFGTGDQSATATAESFGKRQTLASIFGDSSFDFPSNPSADQGGNVVTSIGEGPQFASAVGSGSQTATAESFGKRQFGEAFDFPAEPFVGKNGGNVVTSIGEGPQFASAVGSGSQTATAESFGQGDQSATAFASSVN